MKDHEIAVLVSKLTDTARAFKDAGQLRERIREIVLDPLKRIAELEAQLSAAPVAAQEPVIYGAEAHQLREQNLHLTALYDAVENLIKVKGRHHTEGAYRRLVTAFEVAQRGDDQPAQGTLCRPHSLPDCMWCRREAEAALSTLDSTPQPAPVAAAIRAAALEEPAKVCDLMEGDPGPYADLAEKSACAIRALIGGSKP